MNRMAEASRGRACAAERRHQAMESALCDTDANLKAEAVTWVCSLFERTTHVWHQSTDVRRIWAKYDTYGHGGDLFVKVSCNNVVADISIGVALQYFGGKVVTQLIAEFEEGLDGRLRQLLLFMSINQRQIVVKQAKLMDNEEHPTRAFLAVVERLDKEFTTHAYKKRGKPRVATRAMRARD